MPRIIAGHVSFIFCFKERCPNNVFLWYNFRNSSIYFDYLSVLGLCNSCRTLYGCYRCYYSETALNCLISVRVAKKLAFSFLILYFPPCLILKRSAWTTVLNAFQFDFLCYTNSLSKVNLWGSWYVQFFANSSKLLIYFIFFLFHILLNLACFVILFVIIFFA